MRRRKGKEGMRRGLEEETCRGERGNGEVEERRPRRGVAERRMVDGEGERRRREGVED